LWSSEQTDKEATGVGAATSVAEGVQGGIEEEGLGAGGEAATWLVAPGAPMHARAEVNHGGRTKSEADQLLQHAIQARKYTGLERELTRRTLACLGKSKEDRSGRISLVTREDEEVAVVAVLDAVLIASSRTLLAAGRSSWARRLGGGCTAMATRRRPCPGGSREPAEHEEFEGGGRDRLWRR
jgi:hypothetical protein